LRQALNLREIEPPRGGGKKLVSTINVILSPGGRDGAGQDLETRL
jgi:hypothetical protein